MNEYEFTVILKDVAEMTDELANDLYEAGCEDASPASSEGRAWVIFHRDADSLEAAIRSAIANVQQAGLQVARVELEPRSLVKS